MVPESHPYVMMHCVRYAVLIGRKTTTNYEFRKLHSAAYHVITSNVTCYTLADVRLHRDIAKLARVTSGKAHRGCSDYQEKQTFT